MTSEAILTKPLILEKLAVSNFRAFRELNIERFGRVNLIVGKNNVGKTCLLEALWLYASRGNPEVIRQILAARNEFVMQKAEEDSLRAVKHLFYGRKNLAGLVNEKIAIGLDNLDNNLLIQAILGEQASNKQRRQALSSSYTNVETQNVVDFFLQRVTTLHGLSLLLVINPGNQIRLIHGSFEQFDDVRISEIPSLLIPANGMSADQITQLWRDEVYLTHLQDDVEEALRIIEPGIKNVGLVPSAEEPGHLIPQVRLAGLKDRVLLSSLGEGMNRLFSLALALVNVSNGFLLIDEIGNGLHYSIQPQIWNFIFTVAARLNVQVFATTHSWDAVEAFQQAAQAHSEAEGMLISLRNKQGSPGVVVGTLFNEQDLAYVTREQIEVR